MLAKNPISFVARLAAKTALELSVSEWAAFGTTVGPGGDAEGGAVGSTDYRRDMAGTASYSRRSRASVSFRAGRWGAPHRDGARRAPPRARPGPKGRRDASRPPRRAGSQPAPPGRPSVSPRPPGR